MNKEITILGGGPAGLACAWYAHQLKIPFQLYEGSGCFGGNARTLHFDDFHLDTGAHRLHDIHPTVTEDWLQLLGDDVIEVKGDSAIVYKGSFIDFPLSIRNVLNKLTYQDKLRFGISFLGRKRVQEPANFKELVHSQYGKSLADEFFTDYSAKLWGAAADQLSTNITGKRLHKLSIKSLFAKKTALEGDFYYPKQGIGELCNKLVAQLPKENLHLNSPVESIQFSNSRIESVNINAQKIPVQTVINTLPLSLTAKQLNSTFIDIRFQDISIVFIGLDKPTVADYATLYFPEKSIPFSRIVEPKFRSPLMSPPTQTSLAVEVPGKALEPQEIIDHLIRLNLIKKKDVLFTEVIHIPNAYPILTNKAQSQVETLRAQLAQYTNCQFMGRNATFKYSHLHDQFFEAKNLMNKYASEHNF